MFIAMDLLIQKDEPILVTGANGFIGARVVDNLLRRGYQRITCLVRSGDSVASWMTGTNGGVGRAKVVQGNLLSPADCSRAVEDATVIYHLAASTDKSFAGSYLSTVVATRNLLDATVVARKVKRFVNVSSFAVYSNWQLAKGAMLDESCPVETEPHIRHEPYCYAKAKQEELALRYMKERQVPVVIIRPGAVYGPHAGQSLSPRVGIDTFGFFLHLGGGNQIPLVYVDNCAEGIVLGGLITGIEGEVFNLVDDDLPSSRSFLRMYKRQVGHFRSIYIPYKLFYLFSHAWEKYSTWSRGQFQPVFNRRRAAAYWKGNCYSNEKAKRRLGWNPLVSFEDGAKKHFAYFKTKGVQPQ